MSGLKRTLLILIEEPAFWAIIIAVFTVIGMSLWGRA